MRAIRHLVASAVNGLKPQRVSVVDETGRLLADGARTIPRRRIGDEREAGFERRMREQVESIVTSVVGPGRARVQLTAEFDFNRITQTSDKFDPESRVVRSSQTREESSANAGDQDGQVTVGNELPGNQARTARAAGARPEQEDRGNRQLRDFPHHQDRSDRGRPRQARSRSRCWSTAATPRTTRARSSIQPRSKEELDRIAALVRTAIGFDQKRGDQVEVVNLRFAEAPASSRSRSRPACSACCNSPRTTSCTSIELGVMVLLGLVVLFMVSGRWCKRILASGSRPGAGRRLDAARWPTATAQAGAARRAAARP